MTSLDKALLLLDTLGRNGKAGVKDLSRSCDMPPSTVHRLLSVLGGAGYVRQDPRTRQYHLSLKLLELGAKVRADLDLAAAAAPVMHALMEQSGETVNLVMFDAGEAVYVHQETSTRSMLRMFTRVGARVPLYCSGVGKAWLALRGDAEALAYWSAITPVAHTGRTIVDPDVFLAELGRVRAQGYAVDDEEMEAGVRCVAALVFQAGGAVAGAMSISGPGARLTPEHLPGLARMLVDSAAEVSARLGHSPEKPGQHPAP